MQKLYQSTYPNWMGVRVIRPKRQIDGVSEAFQQDEVEGSEAEDLGGLRFDRLSMWFQKFSILSNYFWL